jgi:hypothetical protein
MGLNVVSSEASRPDQEFEPARAPALGAGLGAAEKISLADNADETTSVDNRESR